MNAPLQLSAADPRPSLRLSVSETVSEGLILALEEGRLSPGQRLVEADLCLRFGVSRGAVREALQRLASDGVVELSRNRGATIREVSPEQALKTLEMTEVLLGLTARSAARAIAAPGAAALMRQVMERMMRAVADDDDRPFLRARSAYYGALLRIGGNQELQRIFPTVQVHVLRAQYHLTRLHRRLHRDFQAIGEAVLAGDTARAERAARRHVRSIRTILATELTNPETSRG